jgi:hypothetical protein
MSNKKRIKIAVVNPPSICVDDDRLEPPLGPLYLAATARQHGYEDVVAGACYVRGA